MQAELGEGEETAGVVTQLQEHMGRHFADIECPDDLLTLNRLVGWDASGGWLVAA